MFRKNELKNKYTNNRFTNRNLNFREFKSSNFYLEDTKLTHINRLERFLLFAITASVMVL